jgi:hypothetical protein
MLLLCCVCQLPPGATTPRTETRAAYGCRIYSQGVHLGMVLLKAFGDLILWAVLGPARLVAEWKRNLIARRRLAAPQWVIGNLSDALKTGACPDALQPLSES